MLATCNLCGFILLPLGRGPFALRCARCLSTFVHRAMGRVLDELQIPPAARVYELSSRGALFKYLRRRHRDLTFSEYFDDVPPRAYKNGVQCQDVQQLSYADGSFDLVTSTEVFEHVPDDRRGFREVRRVLARDGHFVFTVPFHVGTTIERARLENGRIVHLLPAEYHADRIRGRHVLAFRNYGNDIIDRLREAGFARAEV